MASKFKVSFFSDEQFELMTAEILFNDQILCQISQDQGVENMEIEFFHEHYILKKEPRMKFPISEFFSLIENVKLELAKYR